GKSVLVKEDRAKSNPAINRADNHDKSVPKRAVFEVCAEVGDLLLIVSDKTSRWIPRDCVVAPSQGVERFSQVIAIHPEDAYAHLACGTCRYRQKDIDLALKDLNKAIRLCPNWSLAFFTRGFIYHDRGQYDDAIRDYNQAIRLDSSDDAVLYSRGL